MPDHIRRLSHQLAGDPSGLVFLHLGEVLLRDGQLDLALKVALLGLEQHPHSAAAHDLLARVHADRGELQQAHDEWDIARELAPGHVAALEGLAAALAAVETPLACHSATEADAPVLAGPRGSARALFADILGEDEHTALLVDDAGRVTAGVYITADGSDATAAIGAELAGLGGEARRVARDLELGDWRTLVCETDDATVAMAPAAGDSMVLLAASQSVPLGVVWRVLERCVARGRAWLGSAA